MFIKVNGSDSPVFLATESIAVIAYAPPSMFGIKSLVWTKGIPDGMPIKETPEEILKLILFPGGGAKAPVESLFGSNLAPSEGNT